MRRSPSPTGRLAAAAALSCCLIAAAGAHAAVEPLVPRDDALRGPLDPFVVQFTAREYAPSLFLYRSRAAAEGRGRRGDSFEVSVLRREGRAGRVLLRPIESIPAGRYLWRVQAIARGDAPESFPTSEPRLIEIPRIVSMTRERFARRGASVRMRYMWRTNSPRLIHRVEVFHNGTRVRRTQSIIKHSPGRNMLGQVFNASATLARPGQRVLGAILPGRWVVRVTISDGVRRSFAARRYIIR
ncbi:MAG: hypothetical protein RLN63_05825 [Miltoncostaeaceae bacterium]